MSDEQPPVQVKRRHWRNTQPRLEPAAAERQGAAARHAWSAFEDRDSAVAFMNGHHDELGGRPIDIAIGSAAGLASVREAIDRSAANASSEN
jgi:hypothetical protein